jgi:hypothetical protein
MLFVVTVDVRNLKLGVCMFHIVAYLLKPRIADPEKTAVALQ